MGFGGQLRAARERSGLTQQQVANALGINKTTYSGYETGKREPDVFKIKALARLFRISGDELLETGFQSELPSLSEMERIKKFRELDAHGKDLVDTVLEKEHARVRDNVTPFPPAAGTANGIAARGGGVRPQTEEERRRAEAVYEKLILPDLKNRRKGED